MSQYYKEKLRAQMRFCGGRRTFDSRESEVASFVSVWNDLMSKGVTWGWGRVGQLLKTLSLFLSLFYSVTLSQSQKAPLCWHLSATSSSDDRCLLINQSIRAHTRACFSFIHIEFWVVLNCKKTHERMETKLLKVSIWSHFILKAIL